MIMCYYIMLNLLSYMHILTYLCPVIVATTIVRLLATMKIFTCTNQALYMNDQYVGGGSNG